MRTRLLAVTGISTLTAALLAPINASAAPSESGYPVDGLSPATAAASCWELKQQTPAIASGKYWLVTPELVAPQQFYCDMTTDGGGWVLVGRGREGWSYSAAGLGTTAQVADVVDGVAAFAPRQLSADTIDGLLNGGRVDALTDGVRLRRAADSTGSQWQESRFSLQKMGGWAWAFGAEYVAKTFNIGGLGGTNGATSNFGSNNAAARVTTTQVANQGWTWGWAYGASITGQNSANSYLWSATNGLGAARPFTQVYLRPKLTRAELDFPTLPAGGMPAIENSSVVSSRPAAQPWGVAGLANGQDTELSTEVQDFVEANGRMYVAGNFRYVQRDANGTSRVEQSYLAAFDVNTGEWIDSFRPVLNNQVKSVEVLPNGKIVAGGQFNQVNGQPVTGVVALDPVTGATDTGWQLRAQQSVGTSPLLIRTLKVHNGHLYVGGTFTHLQGGTRNSTWTYSRNLARVSVTDATPDHRWWMSLNASVNEIDFSGAGDKVFAGGYFTANGTSPLFMAGGFSTATPTSGPAATDPWTYSGSAAKSYVQTVKVTGNKLWVGGSEHTLTAWDYTNGYTRLNGLITKAGGDFQSSAVGDGVLYATCHCNNWVYSDAYTWSNVGTNWTRADAINLLFAVDPASGKPLPNFVPAGLDTRRGLGPWATVVDSKGAVWTGGDINSAGGQWAGGFARFPASDHTAPQAPSDLQVSRSDATVNISWSAAAGASSYELLMDGRVVATGSSTSAALPMPTGGVDIAVRGVDQAGNRSATTPARSFDGAVEPKDVQLVANGSQWKWRYSTEPLASNWVAREFDDSGWSVGTAPLGFGHASVVTNISTGVPTPRPISAQFRRSFDVVDPAKLSNLQVSTRADDGIVVYVNGVEVGRRNLPGGALTANTYATAAPSTASALADPVTFDVPQGVLVVGQNVITVEVHANYRSTPNLTNEVAVRGVESP